MDKATLLNSKELVEKAARKEPTSRIPLHHIGFSSRAASHILGREAFVGGGIQQWREAKSFWEGWHEEFMERSFKDAVDLSFSTGQDIIRSEYWRAPKKPTGKVDEYTYLYEYGSEKSWRILHYYPESEQSSFCLLYPETLTVEDIKRQVEAGEKKAGLYQPKEEDFSSSLKAQSLYGNEKLICGGGVSVGIPIRQANVWMEAMLTDPGIVSSHIAQQVSFAEKNVPFLAQRGFMYLKGGLDFASEQGPMFSPKLFRDLILPGLQKVSSICHKYGCYHFFASDGNLWPVAGLLFGESGIDGYYEVDRRAGMDMERLRQEYPALTLMGNISSWTLSRGTEKDIKKEVLSCLETAKKYSGIIAGVSNYVMPETPPENIEIMIDMLKQA